MFHDRTSGHLYEIDYILCQMHITHSLLNSSDLVHYVKNSIEAAEMYCKAFGAEITYEIKNDTRTTYEHCELSVNGEGFLALAEAANPCDINVVHKMK